MVTIIMFMRVIATLREKEEIASLFREKFPDYKFRLVKFGE